MCKFLIIFKVLDYIKKEEKITNYDNNKLKMRKSLLLLCLKLKRCSIKCDNILFLILFIYYIQHL